MIVSNTQPAVLIIDPMTSEYILTALAAQAVTVGLPLATEIVINSPVRCSHHITAYFTHSLSKQASITSARYKIPLDCLLSHIQDTLT